MNVLLFLAPFSWGTQKREAAAPKASGCFMGGTCAVREEPGKQKPRSCRAQELAPSCAQENARQKKDSLPKSMRIVRKSTLAQNGLRKPWDSSLWTLARVLGRRYAIVVAVGDPRKGSLQLLVLGAGRF